MIKRLSQCIREYKKDAILSPLYVLVESLLDVAIPFVMAGLIDKGIEAGNMSMILRYGAILVGFALVALTFGALSGRSCARATAGFARNLRHDMFHHLQVYSFSNIDKFSSAGLVTRLTTDVSNVQNAFMMIIRPLIRCPAMLIFAMVMSFRINHDISLIFLAVIPILGVGLYLIIKHVHPVFERVFKTYDRLNGVVQENLSGIRVVKNFVREDHEIEKFDTISGTIYNDFSLAERILALNSPLMQGCVYACMILVSWLGAKQIVIGNMSTGNLMSFFTYIMQILSSLMMLSMVFVMITMSRASAERIVEVLKQNRSAPVPVEKQVAILYATIHDLLVKVKVADVAEYEKGLYEYLENDAAGAAVMETIRTTGNLDKDTEEALKGVLSAYTESFVKAH